MNKKPKSFSIRFFAASITYYTLNCTRKFSNTRTMQIIKYSNDPRNDKPICIVRIKYSRDRLETVDSGGHFLTLLSETKHDKRTDYCGNSGGGGGGGDGERANFRRLKSAPALFLPRSAAYLAVKKEARLIDLYQSCRRCRATREHDPPAAATTGRTRTD